MRRVLEGRVVLSALLLVGAVLVGLAAAQSPDVGRPGLPPALLRAPSMPKPGGQVQTRVYWIGHISQGPAGAAFYVIRSSAPGAPPQTVGLRVRINQTDPKVRQEEAIVAASDLRALMSALSEIEKAMEERRQGDEMRGGSLDYRFGSLGIGLMPTGAGQSLYLLAGNKEQAKLMLPFDELHQISAFVKRAAKKIHEFEEEQARWPKAPG